MTRMIVALLVFLLCSPAAAGPLAAGDLRGGDKGWFYNRPGVSVAQAEADLGTCTTFGRRAAVIPGRNGGLAAAVIDAIEAPSLARAITDDCMIALSYRRFNTNDRNIREFEQRYQAMDGSSRAALLSSENPPEGALARRWVNTFWTGLGREGDQRPDNPTITAADARQLARLASIRPVEPGDSITLGANDALLVVTVKWDSPSHARPGVVFSRVSPETGMPELVPMGRSEEPSWVQFETSIGARHRLAGPPWATQFVLVVPAGNYALRVAAGSGRSVQLCFGTVGFAAEPGAVLDLGVITLAPGSREVEHSPPAPFTLRIDPASLEDDRRLLESSPELAASLEPAIFRDGVAAPCFASGEFLRPYGMDLPLLP